MYSLFCSKIKRLIISCATIEKPANDQLIATELLQFDSVRKIGFHGFGLTVPRDFPNAPDA
jgi:hypothetical protein